MRRMTLLFIGGMILTTLVINLLIPKQVPIKIVMKMEYTKFFFVETSGSTALNPRQACAVESTARYHRLSNLSVIMLSPNVSEQTTDLFRTMPNVHIMTKTLDELFLNSPLEGWYKKGKWRKSKFLFHHLSDAIRLLLIWTYGGIYLDLDIVILKSLYGMRKNFLIDQGIQNTVANGILSFEPHHPLISACLQDFIESYKPDCFACVGPVLVTRLVTSLCNVTKVLEVTSSNCNLTVYPPETAFPVKWQYWKDYFDEKKATKVLSAMGKSRMIHVWNKSSGGRLLSLNSGSAYEKIMQQHCPNTYRLVSSSKMKF